MNNQILSAAGLDEDIAEVLLGEDELDGIISGIAAKITRDYGVGGPLHGGRLLLLGILKGSVVFMSELMKKIKLPLEIDFMRVSSYGASSSSTGQVNILLDLHRRDMNSLNILVIEDIIDSGRTLTYLTEYLKLKGAGSVRCCTLLDKPSRREVEFTPDYVGAVIPDSFVVGFGLDYNEKYRALPYVGILKREVYEDIIRI